MHASMRKIVNVAKTCKKAVWKCLKNVRRIKLFGSKRSKRAHDVINTVTVVSSDMPQEAASSATIDLPEETVLVSSDHQEIVQTSADSNHTLAVVCNEQLQKKKRAKRIRRKKVVKPETEKLLLFKTVTVDDKSQNTDHDLHAVECGHVTGNCSEDKPQATVVSEQSDEAGDIEFGRILEKVGKQHADHSQKVPYAKDKQNANKTDRTSSKPTETSVPLRCEEQTDHEKKPADAFNKSRGNTALTKLSELSSSGHRKRAKRLQRNLEAEKLLPVNVNKSGPTTRDSADISCSNDGQETCKSRGVMAVSEQTEDAGERSWASIVAKPRKRRADQSGDVPCAKEQLRINKPNPVRPCHDGESFSIRFERKTAYEKKPTEKQCSSSRDLNNNIKLILNTITTDNMAVLSKNFAALPIDTIERLDNTVDLVFEKAIRKPIVAYLCAVLCSAMQSVNVTCANGKKTTSFQAQILRKCQSSFEADKANRTESAKKLAEIKACRNPKKKKELQFSYDENEKRWRKRSLGNCQFIGELFKQRILRPSILQYCIENLTSQRSDSALECLCSILKITGKESEQCGNLSETLDTLKDLTSDLSISSRVRSMIQEVIDLRRL